ncbi:MAG: hypothetical protein RLZZ299_2161 [Pseudomonadota bacterium]|jgi:hypothetical protein
MLTLLLLACGQADTPAGDTSSAPPPPALVLNEFMAKNMTAVADAAGEYDDWVELHASGDADVPLAGLYLSDDADDPLKFALDADVVVPAGGFVLVWCDDDEETQGADHAGFKLSGDGGSLAVHLSADGYDPVAVDLLTYELQADDVSMARSPDGSATWVSDPTPTPGETNDEGG